VAKDVQANSHKTKGDGGVIDLTDIKVKSVKHFHYMKTEANMDASSHLKRKLEAVEKLMTTLDCDDEDDLEVYTASKKKCKEISILIVEELEKQDAKFLGKHVVTSSSNSIEELSIDLSRINQLDGDDDNEEGWV